MLSFCGKVLPLLVGHSAVVLTAARGISLLPSTSLGLNNLLQHHVDPTIHNNNNNNNNDNNNNANLITLEHYHEQRHQQLLQQKSADADVYYTGSDIGTYSSTAPVIYSPTLYLVGGLLAIAALFLALATQKEKKLTSPQRNSPSTSPNEVRKVRWRLGDASSDEEQGTTSNTTSTGSGCGYSSHYSSGSSSHGVTPSYDGCYYGADPQDYYRTDPQDYYRKTPSPQTSRRFFH